MQGKCPCCNKLVVIALNNQLYESKVIELEQEMTTSDAQSIVDLDPQVYKCELHVNGKNVCEGVGTAPQEIKTLA